MKLNKHVCTWEGLCTTHECERSRIAVVITRDFVQRSTENQYNFHIKMLSNYHHATLIHEYTYSTLGGTRIIIIHKAWDFSNREIFSQNESIQSFPQVKMNHISFPANEQLQIIPDRETIALSESAHVWDPLHVTICIMMMQ